MYMHLVTRKTIIYYKGAGNLNLGGSKGKYSMFKKAYPPWPFIIELNSSNETQQAILTYTSFFQWMLYSSDQ